MFRLFAALQNHFRGRPSANDEQEPLRKATAVEPNKHYVSLDLSGTDITELPPGVTVEFSLRVRECEQLRRLPCGLCVGSLDARGCTLLEGLPEGFSASFVDISDCPQFSAWPRSATISVGRLRARNCLGLTALPGWLGRISQLDLAGCANIDTLPAGLEVTSWIDLAGTGIRTLPVSLAGVGLRWRGVPIDERIAFRPGEITAAEVLSERNTELRRVKLERMGFQRFLADATPATLDSDRDAGGERKLYRVELPGDEPLVCVSVKCPSTGRHYLLRVPPTMTTCRQAVAWTAGFDDPEDYQPRAET